MVMEWLTLSGSRHLVKCADSSSECSLLLRADDRHDCYSYIAPIAQSVSALDFNFERAVEGSILTAGKRLSLKI